MPDAERTPLGRKEVAVAENQSKRPKSLIVESGTHPHLDGMAPSRSPKGTHRVKAATDLKLLLPPTEECLEEPQLPPTPPPPLKQCPRRKDPVGTGESREVAVAENQSKRPKSLIVESGTHPHLDGMAPSRSPKGTHRVKAATDLKLLLPPTEECLEEPQLPPTPPPPL
ncbi:hypothetical protein RUM43_012155 [Polyplax serrata]|uniref:Uncharacterized protein n=1 Tax=Polyplax serrata TaxID=468196 RepID=A0AAN8S9U2_POLSC